MQMYVKPFFHMKTILIYVVCWVGMVAIGILDGMFRDYSYGRYIHDLTVHQLSTTIGLILIGVFIWFLVGECLLES